MRFPLRRVALLSAAGALVFFCSCDKHHVGELPEVQKEHVDIEAGSHAAPPAHSPEAADASATPTPADFFPQSSPH
jgi:hypothetical protein